MSDLQHLDARMNYHMIMILSFQTDRSLQTVQIQIRLLLEVFTVCYSICTVLMKCPKVWPLCLNFKKITAKFSGVQKFTNFTVDY